MTQAKAVAKKAPVEISTKVQRSSNIEVDADMISPPRVQIAQALSDVVKDQSVKIGHFYNTATGEDYGLALNVIPLRIKQGAVYLTPEKGLVCSSMDGRRNNKGELCQKCPHGAYYKDWDNGTPLCSVQLNCIVVLPDHEYMPALLSFTKANFTTGKKIVSMINWNTNITDPHECMFTFKAELKNTGKGEFYAIAIGEMNPVDKELVPKLAEITESFSSAPIPQERNHTEPISPEQGEVVVGDATQDEIPF